MDELLEQIQQSVTQRQKDLVVPLTRKAIEQGLDPDLIIKQGFIRAMETVGEQFGSGEIFIPEMLASAMLMNQALELIKPLIKKDDISSMGKVLICTVKGDLHDIGKNIVTMMLEGNGLKVIDLGVDISVETIITKINEEKPQVLALSALLTTTIPEMKKIIDEIISKGLRDKIKIMVGGAPVTSEFAASIAADGFGVDAAEAVKLAKSWVSVSL